MFRRNTITFGSNYSTGGLIDVFGFWRGQYKGGNWEDGFKEGEVVVSSTRYIYIYMYIPMISELYKPN